MMTAEDNTKSMMYQHLRKWNFCRKLSAFNVETTMLNPCWWDVELAGIERFIHFVWILQLHHHGFALHALKAIKGIIGTHCILIGQLICLHKNEYNAHILSCICRDSIRLAWHHFLPGPSTSEPETRPVTSGARRRNTQPYTFRRPSRPVSAYRPQLYNELTQNMGPPRRTNIVGQHSLRTWLNETSNGDPWTCSNRV